MSSNTPLLRRPPRHAGRQACPHRASRLAGLGTPLLHADRARLSRHAAASQQHRGQLLHVAAVLLHADRARPSAAPRPHSSIVDGSST